LVSIWRWRTSFHPFKIWDWIDYKTLTCFTNINTLTPNTTLPCGTALSCGTNSVTWHTTGPNTWITKVCKKKLKINKEKSRKVRSKDHNWVNLRKKVNFFLILPMWVCFSKKLQLGLSCVSYARFHYIEVANTKYEFVFLKMKSHVVLATSIWSRIFHIRLLQNISNEVVLRVHDLTLFVFS